MCRSEGESTSFRTYLPGCRTAPGTSTGFGKVTTVILFHSSEYADGANIARKRAQKRSVPAMKNRFMSCSPPQNIQLSFDSCGLRSRLVVPVPRCKLPKYKNFPMGCDEDL